MDGTCRTPAGQSTPTNAMAVRETGQDPAHMGPCWASQAEAGAWDAAAAPIEVQGHSEPVASDAHTVPAPSQRLGSQSVGMDRIGFTSPDAISAQVQEIRAPAREEPLMPPAASRVSRGLRYALIAAGLAGVLGLGWISGLNPHRAASLARTSTRVHQGANSSAPSLGAPDALRKQAVGSTEGLAGRTAPGKSAGQDAASRLPSPREVSGRTTRDPGGASDRGRKTSDGAARDLTSRIEQIRAGTEQTQREIISKLGRLGERLEHMERQLTGAPAARTASPAKQPHTIASLSSAALPPRRATPGFGTKASPRAVSSEARPDTAPRSIEGWTVREVFGGTAVLEGPQGVLKVSAGEMVPGVGRVESIVRWGSRWVVATSRGLITTN